MARSIGDRGRRLVLERSLEPGDRWAFCDVDDAYWQDAHEVVWSS